MRVENRNREIIDQRWSGLWERLENAPPFQEVEHIHRTPAPTLKIDRIHLTSRYDRVAEAARQAERIPADSSAAWVYGFALGDIPRVLLARDRIEELWVVILSPAAAYQSLLHFDHSDWLEDPRLTLLPCTESTKLYEPFAVAPGCLHLVDGNAARVRDLIQLALDEPSQRRKYEALEDSFQVTLEENRPFYEKDGDVASFFGTCPGGIAVVVAAGPTLQGRFQWLRDHREGKVVIAVAKALVPLQRAGITPDVVVVVDRLQVTALQFADADFEALRDTPLVYLPTVHRDALELWRGPRLTMYTHQPRFLDLHRLHPKGYLFCSGTVTHAAVDLGVKMGCREVILLGADLCFPAGRTHVSGAAKTWTLRKDRPKLWVLNGHGRRAPTLPSFAGFLRDLEDYISRHPEVTFVNTGREGAEIKGTTWLIDEHDEG